MKKNGWGELSVCVSQDTVVSQGKEGVHRAMYSLVSWVLRQGPPTLRAFWSSLTKDYNMESYPKLHTLLTREPARRRWWFEHTWSRVGHTSAFTGNL